MSDKEGSAPIRRIRQREYDRALRVRGHCANRLFGEGLRLPGEAEQNRRAVTLDHVVEADAVLDVGAHEFGLCERRERSGE